MEAVNLIGLWRRQSVAWASPLTPDSAATRLREGLTQRRRGHELVGLALRGDTDVAFAGQVAGRRFEVYPFRPGMRNSFRPTLRGELVPVEGGGCSVVGQFAYPLFTRVFVALWTAVTVTAIVAALIAAAAVAVNGDVGDAAPLLGVAGFAAGMLAFGALLFAVGSGEGPEGQTRVREWVDRIVTAP
jgi:hypothetical protein